MSNRRLADKIAVVTGAGRGLGRAVAVGMAREGAEVWICARTGVELEGTALMIREAGGRVVPREVDLSQGGECNRLAEEILTTAGRADILVNNAGVLTLTSLENLTPQEWSLTIAVNLTAPFLLTRSLVTGMRRGGGSVINVSSRAGVLGFADESAYCASKFGLEGLTRALALELEGTGVSLNTVTPGLKIKPTSLTEAEIETTGADVRQQWNDPDDLVPAFIYLAGLRGEVSGMRFDAHKLSQVLSEGGYELPVDRVKELAE
jgi:NAD(P)-dependent dehydrogenase (short-subunit alcohol dehydrogenase family)